MAGAHRIGVGAGLVSALCGRVIAVALQRADAVPAGSGHLFDASVGNPIDGGMRAALHKSAWRAAVPAVAVTAAACCWLALQRRR